MVDDKVFKKLQLEWEGSLMIFDDIRCSEDELSESLEARILFSKRKTDLQDMIERFSTALGFASVLNASENPYTKAVLAFCIVAIVNPFKVKILKGNGLDDLLGQAELDVETDERKVEIRKFLEHCKKADISSALIGWLCEHDFAYTTDTHVVFRNSFKQGNVFSRA